MSARFAAARSVVILTLGAVIAAHANRSAWAQSVDIAGELTENSEIKVPILRTHPWRWFRDRWLDEMDRLDSRFGLRLGVSFTTIYQHAAGLSSPNNTAVANTDVIARWHLLDLGPLGQTTAGALFRDRNNFAELNGNDLSQSIGLPWGINNSGSSDYTRVNQLWWQQSMLQKTLILKVGRLDEKALFDQNRVAASDAKQFIMQTLVHSQTVAFPSNGGGLNLRYEPQAGLYMTAGIGDANGNPDRTATEGFDSLAKGDYFEAGEVGVSPDFSSLWARAGKGTYRFMGWYSATTSTHPAGGGFALSFDQEFGRGIVPFLRFGYCPADLFDNSVDLSWGVGTVRPFDRPTDLAGIGASWGKPVQPANRDQLASEVFYRLEVVDGIAVSADAELIFHPALQPNRDFVAVLGLRTRLSL